MTKEGRIKQAAERGIVEGAKCRSPYGTTWVVGPTSRWALDSGDGLHDGGVQILSTMTSPQWATVITPAPTASPQEQTTKGLVDGMACEPDEHMRKAIVAKAKELGLANASNYSDYPALVWKPNDVWPPFKQGPSNDPSKTMIPPGEFYDRLCAMPPKTKPIIIDGHEVKYLPGGYINFGCTTVSAADLDTIHAESLKNR